MRDMDRFMTYVDQSAGPDACHPWTGMKRSKGYGGFRAGGKLYVAHRWLLGELRGSPLEWPREVGCHRCDNPLCCNPAHLYVGDHATNAVDAIERGNHAGKVHREKTHCPSGHPYDAANTGWYKQGRYCRTCKRTQANEWHKAARRERGLKQPVRLENGRFKWVAA